MICRQLNNEKKLFYTKLDLNRPIRKDHLLNKIGNYFNFEFIYHQVQDTYGRKGNGSVSAPITLTNFLADLLILKSSTAVLTENLSLFKSAI
jgi:hypothetical protein